MIALAITFLNNCGFTLRGHVGLPDGLDRFSVVGNDTALIMRLEEVLVAHGASVMAKDHSAAVKIHLVQSEYSRKVRSTDVDGYATSYTLHYRVHYDVRTATGNRLLDSQPLMLRRVLNYNPLQHLQFEEEEAFLKMEMHHEIAQLILHRLYRLRPD